MTDQVQDVQATEQTQEPIILTFQMTLENVRGLSDYLGTQPHDTVHPWLANIRGQAEQQLQALREKADKTEQ